MYLKKRYLIVLLAFLGFVNLYTMRVNLSVAIVAMTENRTVEHDDGTKTVERYFEWDSRERGFILSAFFYGYITTQFIGGFIASKFGGSLVSQANRRLFSNSSTHKAYNGLIKSITCVSADNRSYHVL